MNLMLVNMFFKLSIYALVSMVMITSIDLLQGILVDVLIALKSSLKHCPKHILRLLNDMETRL